MQRSKIRVPREDGSLLSIPDLRHWRQLVADNRQSLENRSNVIGALPLSELRSLARREAASLAQAYLIERRQELPAPDGIDRPWIVTGHQPDLYHPGVWIKNFAVDRLAEATGGIGLHVVADNDICKHSAIRVPAGTPDRPLLAYVPFDRNQAEVPYEERTVADEATFRRFGAAVAEQMASYPFTPLAQEYWDAVCQAKRTNLLGERLSWGRRAVERSMGCQNLEVPLSRLCASEAFRRLAADLLLQSGAFAERYNAVLAEYRALNRIRSSHHPVPALESEESWIEAPFWLWSSESPRRQRMFVDVRDGAIEVRAGNQRVATLPFGGEDKIASVAAALELGLKPWRMRPRALLTTLYMRLCLSDLFIHGVGGGKYDELTDELIRRHFGIEAPAFAILSATVLLPTGRHAIAKSALEQASRLQRDLHWNPDRYLDDALADQEPIAGWIERKHELREETNGAPAERRARFQELRSLNEQLRRYLGNKPQEAERAKGEIVGAYESGELLSSREFAFCLYPREKLETSFRQLLQLNAE